MKKIRSVTVILLAMALSLMGVATGCGSSAAHELKMAPDSDLAGHIKQAPAQVKIAYRFAMANQDVLEQFPCYCGCGGVGHMNNRDCYIDGTNADGTIAFDNHALG